jgi:ADP-heptose:LPS heptosyltransferase
VVRIGALGDVLLTRRLTYSLSLQGFRSTLLAPVRHASLLLKDPWIEGLLDSERPRWSGAFAGEWPAGDRDFDLAVVISRSDDLARAARGAAARVVQVEPGPARDDRSIAQQWAESLGPPFTGRLPSLPTVGNRSPRDEATIIHPGSGAPEKNWPLERFVELTHRLTAQGHLVVWIRGPAETGIATDLPGIPCVDRPPLDVLATTLAQARLFIGNDSGVSHLAAAVGAPTLALFGPTNPRVWTPDGHYVETLTSPLGALDAISVAQVLSASIAVAKLGKPGGSPR